MAAEEAPYAPPRPARAWVVWLQVVLVLTLLASLLPFAAPEAMRRMMAWLSLRQPLALDGLPAEALQYLHFVHGVLGAVMLGWAAALLAVVRGPYAQGRPEGWRLLAASVAVWFVPGTLHSAWQQAWPNVGLNLLFAAAFVLPLRATRPQRSPA